MQKSVNADNIPKLSTAQINFFHPETEWSVYRSPEVECGAFRCCGGESLGILEFQDDIDWPGL